MCIIVYKPQGLSIERQTLETCFLHNPDGAGFMYPCEGRLLIQKGYFEFDEFIEAWEKCRKLHGDSLPVVFHFRIATAGNIDKRNCHPHRIKNDLGFAHNGILSCVNVPKGSRLSDTILYRDRYLGKLSGETLHLARFFNAVARHIGSSNKFVFMNGEGAVVICNEDQGIWKDGIWFSNNSFLPRRLVPFLTHLREWFCEYCGNVLATPEELAEGICLECLQYSDLEPVECGGCYNPLPSVAHQELGWCDECGNEVYGRDWPEMLRTAVTPWRSNYPHECF